MLRATVPGALLACVLALALRLPYLGADSLWYDETVSAYLAEQSARLLIAHTALDIHPPGYYLLLRLWTLLAGNSEYSLAFLSLFFGVLLVPLSSLLARRLFGPPAAVVAAAAAAVSAYSLWYSQEVRMYTLAACLALLLALVVERLPRRPAEWRLALAYGLLATLSLYVLYYLAFLIAFLSLFWLVWAVRAGATRASAWRTWLVAHATALLLYLPWLPTAIRQAIDPPVPPWRSPLSLAAMFASGAQALAGGEALADAALPLAVLAVVLAVAAPIVLVGGRRGALVVGAFAAPWLAIVAASLYRPLFHARYLLPYAPFFWLGLASLTRATGRRLHLGLLALATALVAANANAAAAAWHQPRFRPDDLRSAVRQLHEHWAPGDAVLVNAGYAYTALAYYWRGPVQWQGRLTAYGGHRAGQGPLVLIGGSLGGGASLGWGDPRSDFYATTLSETGAAIERVLEQNRRLWVFRIYDTVTDPRGELRAWLNSSYILTEDQPIPGPSYGRLQAFVPRSSELPCKEPLKWAGELAMCADMMEYPADGDRVAVQLHSSALGSRPLADYHYTLRLVDAAGANVAQRDGVLGGSALAERPLGGGTVVSQPIALLLPPTAPAAQYRLLLGVYVLPEGQWLNLAVETAQGPSELVPLGFLSLTAPARH